MADKIARILRLLRHELAFAEKLLADTPAEAKRPFLLGRRDAFIRAINIATMSKNELDRIDHLLGPERN